MKTYILFCNTEYETRIYLKSFEKSSEAIDFSSRLFFMKAIYDNELGPCVKGIKINKELANTIENFPSFPGDMCTFEIMDSQNGEIIFDRRMLIKSFFKQINEKTKLVKQISELYNLT